MAEDLIFDWKGTDRAGKKVAGETKGRNVNLVKAQLRKQGINAGSVKKRSTLLCLPANWRP
jgi:type IV pilus assembly protein PilC